MLVKLMSAGGWCHIAHGSVMRVRTGLNVNNGMLWSHGSKLIWTKWMGALRARKDRIAV